MKKENKILKGVSYFGTFVIVFIIIIMLWPGESDNSLDSSNIRDVVITSKEQAREEMEKFLLEKYDVSYDVSLPSRTDNGDFSAHYYNPYDNIVEINVETGECRDSGIRFIVEDYLKEKLEPIINSNWNENMQEFSISFINDVPSKDWSVDSSSLDIIETESMSFTTVILVNAGSIDESVEASKVKQLLDLEELSNLNIILEIYYANNEEYQQIVKTYQNNNYTDRKLLMSIDNNYYNKLVVRYNSRKGELTTNEIIGDFVN